MDGLPQLDDSLFIEDTKKKIDVSSMPYNAKFCEKEWFLVCEEPDDVEGIINIHKHRAEYFYLKRDYDSAIKEFRLLDDMELTPAVRRDVSDSFSRCLLKVEKFVEAYDMAMKMALAASSDDHSLQAFRTLAEIQHSLQDFKGELKSRRLCVSISPTCGSLWFCLANVYRSLSNDPRDSADFTNLKNKGLICLLNARQLLKVLILSSSFYKRKHEATLLEINHQIDEFQINDTTLRQLTEIVSKTDFSTSNQEIEEMRSGENADQIFSSRWFDQYDSYLEYG